METIVTSDLHLGSKHCHRQEILRFLDGLPEGAALVLNGDTVTRWQRHWTELDEAVLARLRAESLRRRVVWVRGNHDEEFTLADAAGIELVDSFSIDRRAHVAHGDHFDTVSPHNRLFIILFRWFHALRVRLGAPSIHVALYAKRFTWLYAILRRHVRLNAVEYARENGFAAVICGHTHFVEDETVDGIRYLNTGAWTETPNYCVRVGDASIELVAIGEPSAKGA